MEEREREREIPPLAILPGDAVMYSHSHPPQPTGTTMNVSSRNVYLSRTGPAMVAKMYEALRVKIEKIFKKTDGMGISRMDRFLLLEWNGKRNFGRKSMRADVE